VGLSEGNTYYNKKARTMHSSFSDPDHLDSDQDPIFHSDTVPYQECFGSRPFWFGSGSNFSLWCRSLSRFNFMTSKRSVTVPLYLSHRHITVAGAGVVLSFLLRSYF
jgi:hypothetical protein